MAGPIPPTNEQIADALRRTKGMVYVAADLLEKEHGHCSPNTIKKRLKQYAWLRDVKTQAAEMTKDVTELKLFEAIQRGEPWAIQFYLKTQAKDRGYVERKEHAGAADAPIKVKHGFDIDAYSASFQSFVESLRTGTGTADADGVHE